MAKDWSLVKCIFAITPDGSGYYSAAELGIDPPRDLQKEMDDLKTELKNKGVIA